MSLLLMITYLPLNHSLLSKSLISNDSNFNTYGFFCLPLKTDNKELTPIRLNIDGQLECFTINGTSCFSDAKYCMEKFTMLFKSNSENQVIKCPTDILKHVEGFAWCKSALSVFFKKWICPSTSGLNVAIKLNSFTGNVSCLSRTGETCYTDNQAETACRKANFCTDIELKKKMFNELECGSSKFFDIYGNIGYDAKFNNWCRKAMTMFIDKEKLYYPTTTGTSVIIKFTEKSNPSCISADADTCVEYSKSPSEAQIKYLSNLLTKGLYTTIICGPELQKSKQGVTGYETENHWCRKSFTNVGLSLTLLQPASEITEKNLYELANQFVEDKSSLKKLNDQKTELDKTLAKKKKEMDTAISELRDPLECNQLTDVYLQENDLNIKLQSDIKEEEIKIANSKVKFYEERKANLNTEKITLESLIKIEEGKTEKYPKLTEKYKERIGKVNELIKSLDTLLSEAKKVLDLLLKEKADIDSKSTKNKSEISQNKIKNEALLASRDLERMKALKDLSQKPVLIKPPTPDNKSSEITKYTAKEVQYTPLLTDNAVALYVENFKKVSAEMGFDITAQEIDLNPRIPELSIVKFNFNNNDPSSRQTLVNAVNLSSSDAEVNPYKAAVDLITAPFNQEVNLSTAANLKKNLLFFSKLGTQVKSGDYIILACPLFQKYLKSYDLRYVQPSSGSKQQEVSGGNITTTNSKLDTFGLWAISNRIDDDSTPIKDGSLVKLLHVQTGRVLYSQPYIKSPASKRAEVACFTGSKAFLDDESNNNEVFILRITKSLYSDGVFRVGDSFTLEHYTTGLKLGMGKYLTPRTSQNEVFAFNEEEAKTNSGLSSEWLITASLSNQDDGEAPVETPPTVNPVPSVDSPPSTASVTSTFQVQGVEPSFKPSASNNCSEDKPFCLSSITDATNPNISGMVMREYLKDISFEKIGARIVTNDKIKIANVITATFLSFSSIKSLSGSFREQIVATSNANDNTIMKYVWKRDAGTPLRPIVELEFESTNKLYKVLVQSGFKEVNFNQLQVSAVLSTKANNNAEFYLDPIQSVSPSDNFVRVGNLYALRHVNTNCFLTVADYNVPNRKFNGLLESTAFKEVYCTSVMSYGSVFTINYKLGVNKSENFLPYTAPAKSINNNFVSFMTRDEEMQIESQLSNNSINSSVRTTLTNKRNELRLKNVWVFTQVSDKPSQSALTPTISITDSNIFFRSPLRENNYSKLTPYLQTNYSTEDTGKISVAGRVVIFRHEATGAYLNKSSTNVYGYNLQNLGNFWKVLGNNADDISLVHYITGESLNVVEETDTTKRENDRRASRVFTSGVNGQSNSNAKFEFYDSDFKKINRIDTVNGSISFMIRFKNRGCFLVFVPKKFENNYYIPYCMQESSLSNIPKQFFFWTAFRSVDDGEDINFNQIVEKKILLDKSYTVSVNTAFCCNQSNNGINTSIDLFKFVKSNDFLFLQFIFDEYVVQVQDSIFPGLSQYLAYTRKSSTNDSFLRYFRLINVTGGKFLEDGDTVRFVSRSLGKCLSSNKVSHLESKSASDRQAIEYIVYAAGNNGVCDSNADWIIRKKDTREKRNESFDKRIKYDDEIVLYHKNNDKLLMSFINYVDMLGNDSADKVRSTFVVVRNKFHETQSVLKLKYYGTDNSLESNYFRYSVSDGYASSSSTVANSSIYNLMYKFDKTEVTSDWLSITTKDTSSKISNPDDFKIITSAPRTATVGDFKVITETKATDISNQFSRINAINAAADKSFNKISEISNTDSSRLFNTINKVDFNSLPTDLRTINSIGLSSSAREFSSINNAAIASTNDFKVITPAPYVPNPKTFKELSLKTLVNDAKTFREPVISQYVANSKTFRELGTLTSPPSSGTFNEIRKTTYTGNGSFSSVDNIARTAGSGSFSAFNPTNTSGQGSFGELTRTSPASNGSFGEMTRLNNSNLGSYGEIANVSKAQTLGSLVALK